MTTPINVDKLREYLQGYSSDKLSYLIQGFTNGFHLHFQGERRPQISPNLQSALINPNIVQNKIDKEVELGRVKGPFPTIPLKNLKLSPLGLVPKKTRGEFRLIHHLSYPRNGSQSHSVNSGILSESSEVHYAGIEDAISHVKQCGSGCFMAKTDIKSAFRIIPVHQLDHELLGFSFNNQYYYDTCLPMGCSTSCKIFEAFSTALEWIAVTKLKCNHVIHILDDFMFVEESHDLAESALQRFIWMCNDIGVPIAVEKTFPPSQQMSFVGIALDSVTSTASLPSDKVDKSIIAIQSLLNKSKCSLKDLQSLIGLLNFACSVVVPGRPFLRRLINLTIGVFEPFHHIRITLEAKDDLRVWLQFLQEYNGRTIFIEEKFLSNHTLQLYTDASSTIGYGAVFKNSWLYGVFPKSFRKFNISVLEFYPILLAVYTWGHLWANHSIIFFTDNEALVSVINKQTSKEETLLKMVRCLVLKCLQLNLNFRCRHVAGKRNILADSLSRLQIAKFQTLAQQADVLPTEVPNHLVPHNFFQSLNIY